ncbi:MAG: tryptophan synthase subunit alpha [Myxococcota bacterium]|nr:tryptophan synthase subunit alpha [Myxococcota bacterium]
MNRLQQRLQGDQTALITYLTAGDPSPAQSIPLFEALVEGGADIIEIGVPFSDPGADGPAIQRASERALSAGAGLDTAIEIASALPPSVCKVIFGYLNPFLHRGYKTLAADCAAAGIDGLLCVDCPPGEEPELSEALRSHGIAPILLAAPTTPLERVAHLSSQGQGFLYYVSMTGITGAGLRDPAAIGAELKAVREQSLLPVAVGFGIATPEDAQALAPFADGVVVGSALVRLVEQHGDQAAEPIREAVAALKNAL